MILEITENLCVNLFQNLSPNNGEMDMGNSDTFNILCIKKLIHNFQKIF
jgi:hypothetical protein